MVLNRIFQKVVCILFFTILLFLHADTAFCVSAIHNLPEILLINSGDTTSVKVVFEPYIPAQYIKELSGTIEIYYYENNLPKTLIQKSIYLSTLNPVIHTENFTVKFPSTGPYFIAIRSPKHYVECYKDSTGTTTCSASYNLGFSNWGMINVTVNTPPSITPIGNKSVYEEDYLSFSVDAQDLNDNPPQVSVRQLPQGATFYKRVFSWTPDIGQAGVYSVMFVATDYRLYDYETIEITVKEKNTYYKDEDADGFGNSTLPFLASSQPDGYVINQIVMILTPPFTLMPKKSVVMV